MLQFLQLLMATMQGNHISVVVFFNGAMENKRFRNWTKDEVSDRFRCGWHGVGASWVICTIVVYLLQTASLEKVFQVMRHVRRKCTPPPKVLWMPPAALRTCLVRSISSLFDTVCMTYLSCVSAIGLAALDDPGCTKRGGSHARGKVCLNAETSYALESLYFLFQVMSFLREHDYDALLVEGVEYAFFDPPAYYSAEAIKLTFRGSLETKELILDEVAKQLNLHPQRFPLLAALLGKSLLFSLTTFGNK